MGVWTSTLNSPWVWVAFRAGVETVRRSFHQMRRIPGEDQAERGKQAAGLAAGARGASVLKMVVSWKFIYYTSVPFDSACSVYSPHLRTAAAGLQLASLPVAA